MVYILFRPQYTPIEMLEAILDNIQPTIMSSASSDFGDQISMLMQVMIQHYHIPIYFQIRYFCVNWVSHF